MTFRDFKIRKLDKRRIALPRKFLDMLDLSAQSEVAIGISLRGDALLIKPARNISPDYISEEDDNFDDEEE